VAIIKASVYRPIGRYRRSQHIEIAKSLNMACQIAASFISDGERRYFYAKENRIYVLELVFGLELVVAAAIGY